ncbi:MAG: ABC transporter ATP-binding protein [Ferruginibacter sp.]
MQITLSNTGKRYNREWIFRRVDHTFFSGKRYAITGPNGSGKSTLLQVIAGAIMHTEGKIEYNNSPSSPANKSSNVLEAVPGPPVSPDNAHKQISFAAPYLELIEEMTATELLDFHSTFKQLKKPIPEILEEVSLGKAAHKQIRYFSSGMKQRLKLAQAFFSNVPVLLLDEPTTNLDEDGIALYHQLIKNYAKGKTIIISSNDKQEYDFCEEVISIGIYK